MSKLIWITVASTHFSFSTVIRNSCEDDEIHDINNKLDQEYPVGKSVPFVFQQFIKWLNLEHLETILKQETKTSLVSPSGNLDVCTECSFLHLTVIGLSMKTTLFTNHLSASIIRRNAWIIKMYSKCILCIKVKRISLLDDIVRREYFSYRYFCAINNYLQDRVWLVGVNRVQVI